MRHNVAIIGAGSMGSALAILLSGKGHDITLWSAFEDEISMLRENREHIQKLPGVKIPESVQYSSDLELALKMADIIVLALPSQTVRQNSRNINGFLKGKRIVITCSKGIEDGSCMTLSDVISQEMPGVDVVALSGPSHAEEIARGIPTAVVAASAEKPAAEIVQDMFMTPAFRVYTNPDILGVELGGALKNVIALCAGISDGLGFGDNTKAALMTRGIEEISRLGVAMGARIQTFAGLTGIGDLIVTCTSRHSRNRRAGILIGQGRTLKEALDEVKMVVEGVSTTRPANKLANEKGVSMPITEQAYEVLFNGKDPEAAVFDLMTRDKKEEHDEWG